MNFKFEWQEQYRSLGNMAARGEFFRSFHLPVLSAEQNDSQNDESQAENRPVPVQEAEIRWKKVPFFGRYVSCA